MNSHRIDIIDGHIHRIRNDKLLSTTRIAKYQGKIIFLNALGGNGEIFLRSIGHIILGIKCRLVVFIGINAIHGEVASMAGPHPVISITTELTNAFRRSAHKTDIVKSLINKGKILITIIERLDHHGIMSIFHQVFFHFFHIFLDKIFTIGIIHIIGHAIQHLF